MDKRRRTVYHRLHSHDVLLLRSVLSNSALLLSADTHWASLSHCWPGIPYRSTNGLVYPLFEELFSCRSVMQNAYLVSGKFLSLKNSLLPLIFVVWLILLGMCIQLGGQMKVKGLSIQPCWGTVMRSMCVCTLEEDSTYWKTPAPMNWRLLLSLGRLDRTSREVW